jgi:protein-S-isoprenylcysteine O-methyltransferase Ste14
MESFSNIFLAVAVYGVLHSILASQSMKALAERRLGLFAKAYYRLFFNLLAVLTFGPVLWVIYRSPDYPLYNIPVPLVFLSLLLQAASAGCAAASLLQTGLGDFLGLAQLTAGETPALAPVLNVGGFYRWMRHPLYAFGLLFIWLTPMMTVNLLALILGLTLYILIGIYFEERKLLQVYGQDYADYRARTPMLFPPYF